MTIKRKTYKAAVKFLKEKLTEKIDFAIILGSGLGTLTNSIEQKVVIDYKDIPGMPLPTVEGHSGQLIFGILEGKNILACKGRIHYYEGYSIEEVTFLTRILGLLKIDKLIITNAAGAVTRKFSPGDLMVITDHISFMCPSPLRDIESNFGERFIDMTYCYDKELVEHARMCAIMMKNDVKMGVYAFCRGPMYETKAEIRALEVLGANAVGMSTVPEVIVANQMGIRVLGLSCITNMAAGVLDKPLNHQEVLETAKKVESNFTQFIQRIIEDYVEK